jgi:hypothetical protein
MLGGSRVSTDPSLVVSVYFLDHEYPLILLWWCLSIFWIMNIHWSFYGGVCLFSGSRVSTDPSMVVSLYFRNLYIIIYLFVWSEYIHALIYCMLLYVWPLEIGLSKRENWNPLLPKTSVIWLSHILTLSCLMKVIPVTHRPH